MTAFVLDNSVTMRWWFDSGSHAFVDAVLQRPETARDEAFVPILWRYEVSAVLARAQKNGTLVARKVTEFIEDLDALPITVDTASGDHILTDVHRLAVAYGLTSYDAAYLELAPRLNLPRATLDLELVSACNVAGVIVP